MKVPADLYTRSPRIYRGLEELTYPFHDQTIALTRCGRICFKGRKVNLSHVFAGQTVGVTQFGDRILIVTSMRTIWAIWTTGRAGSNRSARKCYLCLRNGPPEKWSGRLDSNPPSLMLRRAKPATPCAQAVNIAISGDFLQSPI
jgi:hypothetical protein